MMNVLFIVHALICALLIGIILIQAGRGGGLVQGFSGVESMFGTKTNAFLTRTTTILAVLFFITCLSLAFLSAQQGKSLLSKTSPVKATAVKEPLKQETVKPQEVVKPEETTKAQETPKTN